MAKIETWFEQDLKKPVPVRILTGSAFSMDNLGNLIGVKVTDGGEIITLAGSVNGYCILADGQTIPVNGTRSGNMASIVLPQTAYTVPGPIRISIKLTEGNAITTLLACVGTVVRTQTGNIVNPGSVVQDWSTQISAQLQACQDAADAMGSMVAVAFNPSSAYSAGNYVTYQGAMYRITADHAAGTTWADTSKTQATVGAELSDLKAAINSVESIEYSMLNPKLNFYDEATALQDTDIVTATGKLVTGVGYKVSQKIVCDFTKRVKIVNAYYNYLYCYTADGTFLGRYNWSGTANTPATQYPTIGYFRILAKSTDTNIMVTYHSTDTTNFIPFMPLDGWVDDSLSKSRYSADAKVTGDEIKEVYSKESGANDFEAARFNGSFVTLEKGFVPGYWSGGTTFTSGYSSLDIVIPQNLVSIEYTVLSSCLSVGFLLNTSNEVVKTLAGTVGDRSYDIPSTAVRMRINFFGNTYYTGITFKFTNSIKYAVDGVNKINNSIPFGHEIGSTDLTSATLEKKYINAAGGLSNVNNADFSVYQFAVSKGITYCVHGISKISSDSYPICVFSTSDADETFTNIEFIINSGSTSTYRYYEKYFTPKYDGYIYIAGYANYGVCGVSTSVDTVVGMPPLKIQVFGDSITDDTWGNQKCTWATLLQNYMPVGITLTNSAIAASTISSMPSGEGIYDLIHNNVLNDDNDVVVIFSGTNDWGGNYVLGNWDGTSYRAMIPALRNIIEYISTNTESLLIICTPINRYTTTDQSRNTNEKGEPLNELSSPKTLRDYCNAIVEVCNFYGIPVIDLNYESGFNRINIGDFTNDGLHPNVKGAKVLSKYIASRIKQHFGW